MLIFFLLLTLLMALVIALDTHKYIIPNWLVGLVLAAWPVMLYFAPPLDWQSSLVVMAVTFALGYIIFVLGWIGGGDIKLLTACSLWTGWPGVLPFLVWGALLGGALSIILVIIRLVVLRLYTVETVEKLPKILHPKAPVPYGVAIATGFLIMLWSQEIPGLVWIPQL